MSPQAGLSPEEQGTLVCAQRGQVFKQPPAAQPLSGPGADLSYNGGLSPFSSL